MAMSRAIRVARARPDTEEVAGPVLVVPPARDVDGSTDAAAAAVLMRGRARPSSRRYQGCCCCVLDAVSGVAGRCCDDAPPPLVLVSVFSGLEMEDEARVVIWLSPLRRVLPRTRRDHDVTGRRCSSSGVAAEVGPKDGDEDAPGPGSACCPAVPRRPRSVVPQTAWRPVSAATECRCFDMSKGSMSLSMSSSSRPTSLNMDLRGPLPLRSEDDESIALNRGLDELSRRRSDVSCELKRGRRGGGLSGVLMPSAVVAVVGDGCLHEEAISLPELLVCSIVVICLTAVGWQWRWKCC